MRCAIIGAGIAGIAAARQLKEDDWEPVLFDKGQRPGGRLATRRISSPTGETATLDSGAQYFTVRDPAFAPTLRTWRDTGLAREWQRCAGASDEHPRYCGPAGMNALARAWSADLTVHTSIRVESLEATARGWRIQGQDFDAAILTAPLPQSLALLGQPEHPVLSRVTYDRCLAVLAIPTAPADLLEGAGWRTFDDGPISFLADNQSKGISATPAITLHSSGAYALEHWDDEHAGDNLLREAGITAHATYLHRWKFAKATVLHPDRYFRQPTGPPLAFAGDGFAEPRVEGAILSGWAAARAISGK